jgi:hypothetical protein
MVFTSHLIIKKVNSLSKVHFPILFFDAYASIIFPIALSYASLYSMIDPYA